MFKAAGCAAVTERAKKNGRGKSGWVVVAATLDLPACFPSHQLWDVFPILVPLPGYGWLPWKGPGSRYPGKAVGSAVVLGEPGNKMWVGGEGLRQGLEWFALHWERVNQEGC